MSFQAQSFSFIHFQEAHIVLEETSPRGLSQGAQLFSPVLQPMGQSCTAKACPCQVHVGKENKASSLRMRQRAFMLLSTEDMLLWSAGENWADYSLCSNEMGGFPKLMVSHMWQSNWHNQIYGNISLCLLLRTNPQKRQKLRHERQESSSKCQKPIKGLRSLGNQCLALLYKLFSELRPGFYLHFPLELNYMVKGRCVSLTLMNSESGTCFSKFLDSKQYWKQNI